MIFNQEYSEKHEVAVDAKRIFFSEKEIPKTPSAIKVMKYHKPGVAVHVKITKNQIQQSSNGRTFGKC